MTKHFTHISLVLLSLSLLSLPYGYYQFLRIFIFITSLYNLFSNSVKRVNDFLHIGWIIISILYNPILVIHLSRSNWLPINISTILFISLWIYKTKNLTDKNL